MSYACNVNPPGVPHGYTPGVPHGVMVPRPSNPLGVAGFIVSLVAIIFSFGILSPIGVILSFCALFKRPRGFAIAGFVLGLLGSAWILVVLLLGVVLVGATAVGVHAISTASNVDLTQARLHHVREAIVDYQRSNGRLPSTIELLPGLSADALRDSWGEPLHYEPGVGDDFKVMSGGPDRVPGNDDDVAFDPEWMAPLAFEAGAGSTGDPGREIGREVKRFFESLRLHNQRHHGGHGQPAHDRPPAPPVLPDRV